MECMAKSRSASPATPVDNADQPEEEAQKPDEMSSKQTAGTGSTLPENAPPEMVSGGSSVVSGGGDGDDPCGLITPAMRAEEERLHQKTVEDEEEMKRRELMNPESAMERYRKLKHLLSKSQLYAGYLAKRMQDQADEAEERRQRRLKKAARAAEKKRQPGQPQSPGESEQSLEQAQSPTENPVKREEGKENQSTEETSIKPEESSDPPRRTRGGLRARNADSQDSNSQGSQKRGRKRKADSDSPVDSPAANTKIDDFFSTSKRKRQKTGDTESTESTPDVKTLGGKPSGKAGRPKSLANTSDTKATKSLGSVLHQTEEVVPPGLEVRSDGRYLNGERLPDDQPRLLTGGVLRKYQIDGYNWLKSLYENGVNGILADEMGLGKTIQCISLVSNLVDQGINGPYLVCGPLSTVPNWVAEFQRFAPRVPVILYHGTKEERGLLRNQMKKFYKIRDNVEVRPVVVTSYEITMNDRQFIMNLPWKLLIVDEGHRIKNSKCKLITELRMYNSTHRLLLTGTPLQNNLSELWSLLNFLLPEIFDDLSSFQAWFDFSILQSVDNHADIVKEEEDNSILSMLHQILTPFMLRRLKTDVELLIPPKREVLVYAPLTARQQELYRAVVNKTIKNMLGIDEEAEREVKIDLDEKGRPSRRASRNVDYAAMIDGESDGNDTSSPDDVEDDMDRWVKQISDAQRYREERLNGSSGAYREPKGPSGVEINVKLRNTLTLLRKSCNHPYLIEYPLTDAGEYRVDEEVVRASGKLLMLDRMMKELHKQGHKVLIFSQWTSILDILGDYCGLRGWKFSRLDGSMNIYDRRDQMDSFNQDKEVFVFLLSTRAGGLGINLTAADTVIIFDSDWNPQCDLQAQDRCHRIGQTRPVLIYRLVTANTIDQKIVERAAAKRKLEKMVIHKEQFKTGIRQGEEPVLTTTVSPKELLKLLQEIDYDDVVRDDVISQRDLNRLLDRSDLVTLWNTSRGVKSQKDQSGVKTKKEGTRSGSHDVKGVFTIIDQDSGNLAENILSSVNKDGGSFISQA